MASVYAFIFCQSSCHHNMMMEYTKEQIVELGESRYLVQSEKVTKCGTCAT